MRIVLGWLLFASLIGTSVAGEDADRASSYYHFTLARILSQDKRYAEALEEFQKAIELNPKDAELRVHHALTLWESSYIREFVTECEKAIELDPKNPEPHFLLGRYFFTYRESTQTNLLDKALTEFEKVIELDPQHVHALDYLSRLYIMKERWDKAAETLSRLSDLNPSYSNAYYLWALALVRLDRTDEAVTVLEKAEKYDAVEVEHLKLLGGLYLQRREVDKAIKALRQAVEMDTRGEDPELRVELAKALKADRKYQEAVEILSEILKTKSDLDFEATFELAQAFSVMGRREEAITKFKQLLDMEAAAPYRSAIQTHLALVYQDSRQYDKAIELFKQVADANPDKLESSLRLVYALKEAGRGGEALVLADKLLVSHPDQPGVIVAKGQVLGAMGQVDKGIDLLAGTQIKQADPELFLLAVSQLYIDEKKYEDAERIVKQGLEKKPDSESMQFQLGAIYERQEKYTNAEANFRKVLEKNPEHAGVLNYLGYMLAERGLRLDEALGYVKKAVELDPYNGAYLDSLGWVYFKMKQYEPAEVYLKQAVELNDDDPTILEHLGDLYRKIGRYDQAGQYYEKSVSQSKEQEERKRVQGKLTSVKKVMSQRRQ